MIIKTIYTSNNSAKAKKSSMSVSSRAQHTQYPVFGGALLFSERYRACANQGFHISLSANIPYAFPKTTTGHRYLLLVAVLRQRPASGLDIPYVQQSDPKLSQ